MPQIILKDIGIYGVKIVKTYISDIMVLLRIFGSPLVCVYQMIEVIIRSDYNTPISFYKHIFISTVHLKWRKK